MALTKWLLAQVVKIYPGKDGKVRMATIETVKGRYRSLVVKMVPMLYQEDKS